MDKETIEKYAPVAIIVVGIIIQWNLFATTQHVEEQHRIILKEVSERYVLKEQYNDLKKTIDNMQVKIDKMYDVIINRRG